MKPFIRKSERIGCVRWETMCLGTCTCICLLFVVILLIIVAVFSNKIHLSKSVFSFFLSSCHLNLCHFSFQNLHSTNLEIRTDVTFQTQVKTQHITVEAFLPHHAWPLPALLPFQMHLFTFVYQYSQVFMCSSCIKLIHHYMLFLWWFSQASQIAWENVMCHCEMMWPNNFFTTRWIS